MQQPSTVSEQIISDENDIYKQKAHRDHIYEIPDTYAGSPNLTTEKMYLFNSEIQFFQYIDVEFVPVLYKICDEILVNILDQYIRLFMTPIQSKNTSSPSQLIHYLQTAKIAIDRNTGYISFENDGNGIDVRLSKLENSDQYCYVVEKIFGHLLTSTNYENDTTTPRYTGGRNGYGAKLANIFSKVFTVETIDYPRRKKYTQRFLENMTIFEEPIIETIGDTIQPYTKISFLPDFQRFGLTEWTDQMVQIIEKRCYELSICSRGQIQVYYNQVPIRIKTFQQYMNCFPNLSWKLYDQPHDRWEIGIAVSEHGFQQSSFVNGVCTLKGGKHVNYVMNKIYSKIKEHILTKYKLKVTDANIRENIFIFISCQIDKPSFDSQIKETLTLDAKYFGSKFELSEAFVTKLVKSPIVELSIGLFELKSKQKSTISRDERKTGRLNIENLDDAHLVINGGPRSAKCTMVVTEGLSAKSLMLTGFSIIGRDTYGVFPLKGKILNPREHYQSVIGRQKIQKNVELNALTQILGLTYDTHYTSTDQLRYDQLMILSDQDRDGIHIRALIMNWIALFWPELLSMDYIVTMSTPIIKITYSRSKMEKIFYSEELFEIWKKSEEAIRTNYTQEYYKGLGTIPPNEAKHYFKPIITNHFHATDTTLDLFNNLFHKDLSEYRKDWIRNILHQTEYELFLFGSENSITYNDFLNMAYVFHALENVRRNIPQLMDGLKPCRRKILYAAFSKGINSKIKIAQFAGHVSEKTAYHHGEASLYSTITNMAQNYVGSNNIEWFTPKSQMGTRQFNGADAPSARYAYIAMNPLTYLLFPACDDSLLNYLEEDGEKVEPEHYNPIIPMLLVNGASGIATGWSTDVPSYNPLEIIQQYQSRLRGITTIFIDMIPYYRGFNGKIVRASDHSFITKGVYQITAYDEIQITELPIGTSTDSYKVYLENLVLHYSTEKSMAENTPNDKPTKTPKKQQFFLQDFMNHTTDTRVFFTLKIDPFVLQQWNNIANANPDAITDIFEFNLNLTSKISTTNMILWHNNDIQKYDNVTEIMEDFYIKRLPLYEIRKQNELTNMQSKISILSNKIHFIQQVRAKEIQPWNISKVELIEFLQNNNYQKNNDSYKYLSSMSIDSFTIDNANDIQSDHDKIVLSYNRLLNTTIEELWYDELEGLKIEYSKYLQDYLNDLNESNNTILPSSTKNNAHKKRGSNNNTNTRTIVESNGKKPMKQRNVKQKQIPTTKE